MNKKLITFLIIGVSATFLGCKCGAQLVSVAFKPSNSASFNSYIGVMTAASPDLYQEPADIPYVSFVFTTNGATGQFHTDTNNVFGGSFVSQGTDTYFREVTAPSVFMIDGSADIGFIGFEAAYNNFFTVKDSNGIRSTLFRHHTDPPPASATISANSPSTVSFVFDHYSPQLGWADQTNTDRFKFFRSYNPNTNAVGTEWLAVIDDNNSHIDYDDGFFYFQEGITPIPEPSHVAAFAVIGLFGFLMVRKRIKKSNKEA